MNKEVRHKRNDDPSDGNAEEAIKLPCHLFFLNSLLVHQLVLISDMSQVLPTLVCAERERSLQQKKLF